MNLLLKITKNVQVCEAALKEFLPQQFQIFYLFYMNLLLKIDKIAKNVYVCEAALKEFQKSLQSAPVLSAPKNSGSLILSLVEINLNSKRRPFRKTMTYFCK